MLAYLRQAFRGQWRVGALLLVFWIGPPSLLPGQKPNVEPPESRADIEQEIAERAQTFIRTELLFHQEAVTAEQLELAAMELARSRLRLAEWDQDSQAAQQQLIRIVGYLNNQRARLRQLEPQNAATVKAVLEVERALGVARLDLAGWRKDPAEALRQFEAISRCDRLLQALVVGTASEPFPGTQADVVQQTAGTVSQAGGTLVLDDGFRIEVPPGAVAADAEISVRHVRLDAKRNQLIEDFEFYEIKGPKLVEPVDVTIPYTPVALPSEADFGDVRVLHRLENGRVEELPCQVDPRRNIATIRLRSFSSVSKPVFPDVFSTVANSLAGVSRFEHQLTATYYSQGPHPYGWCWAAGLAMLAGTHGRQIQPHEVAAVYQAAPMTGFNLFPVLGYSLETLQSHEQFASLPLRFYRAGGFTEKRLRGYLLGQLRTGKPVWIALPDFDPEKGSDHVVVLMGYNQDGFYIHDSSGSLVSYLEGWSSDETVNHLDKLANYWISFERWSQLVRPWFVQLAYIDRPLPEEPRTVSLQLDPGINGALDFARADLLMDRSTFLQWDGRLASGCGLGLPKQEQNAVQGDEGLCNSDYPDKVSALLHNAGAAAFQGYLEVRLDDVAMAGAMRVEIPARTVNSRVYLYDRQGPAQRLAAPKRDYLPPARRSGTLQDGLDFNRYPLPLGDHVLEVRLLAADRATTVDRVRVPFVMRPAIASHVQVEKQPASESRAVHRVSWQMSGEEVRRGAPNIQYEVWRTTLRNKTFIERTLAAKVPAPEHEVLLDIPTAWARPGLTFQYDVVTTDRGSGLQSPASRPSFPAVDAAPPPVAPAADHNALVGVWVRAQKQSGRRLGAEAAEMLFVRPTGDQRTEIRIEKAGAHYEARYIRVPQVSLDLGLDLGDAAAPSIGQPFGRFTPDGISSDQTPQYRFLAWRAAEGSYAAGPGKPLALRKDGTLRTGTWEIWFKQTP